MDPATGASTWALGSHRCVKNIGIFTKKAITSISQIIFLIFGEKIGHDHLLKNERLPECLKIKIVDSRRGNEARIV